jgi:hypothetical protein
LNLSHHIIFEIIYLFKILEIEDVEMIRLLLEIDKFGNLYYFNISKIYSDEIIIELIGNRINYYSYH